MRSVSGKRLCKILEGHAWKLQRVRGSHYIYAQQGNPAILTVPVHGNKDRKMDTLRQLLRRAGLIWGTIGGKAVRR